LRKRGREIGRDGERKRVFLCLIKKEGERGRKGWRERGEGEGV